MSGPVVSGGGPLRHVNSGKVRDLYEVSDNRLLLVASDRISAFDYVLPTPIPDKGRVLTALTVWWLEQLADVVPNHLLSTDDELIPAEFAGRAMLCRRLAMVPVEAVARGYLTGSGMVEYTETGAVCGIPLPAGLVEADKLAQPIFTPASKAELGEHDENVTYEAVVASVGESTATELRELTIALYVKAAELAAHRGILVADTKFEFGRDAEGRMVLGDEVLTPDSSRFWPSESYAPGHPQPSYDKQYVRDWLTSPESGWSRSSGDEPPPLPDEVVEATRSRYIEAYEKLSGQDFADWPG